MSGKKDMDEEKSIAAKKSGVFLLVVDESAEFKVALKSACDLALKQKGHIALLYVIEPPGFQQWGMVEEQMLAEEKQKAHERVMAAAQIVKDQLDEMPTFYIKEGDGRDVVLEVIEEAGDVEALVLGAGGATNPLIGYFSAKGLSALKVPLFIIPDTTQI